MTPKQLQAEIEKARQGQAVLAQKMARDGRLWDRVLGRWVLVSERQEASHAR
jgi:hypothetical protein